MTRMLRRRKELWSKRGKAGVAARNEKRISEHGAMQVVGGFKTWGNLGEHTVELLFGDSFSERLVAIRVDGEYRKPRTLRGVVSCLSKMIWKKY